MDKILLIPYKSDEERESVLNTWISLGGKGKKIDKFWEKLTELEDRNLAVYGNDTFALVLAEVYNLKLVTPDDSLLARLERKWIKRSVQELTITNLTQQNFPVFIKPVTPKQFKGEVYKSITELIDETKGLSRDERILVSEIIDVKAEARAFILERNILDIATYEGDADVEGARKFLVTFLADQSFDLPHCLVIDVGFNSELGWFIIEFNSSWGAGLNSCDPTKVIQAIVEATQQS